VEVVKAGHSLVKKKPGAGPTANMNLVESVEEPAAEKLHGRCDSLVLETNVHFPTDITLLYDAVRKAIGESAVLAAIYGISGWRQSTNNSKQVKKQYRKVQTLKHSTSKDEEKKRTRAELIKKEHTTYIELAEKWIQRSEQTIEQLKINGCEADRLREGSDDFKRLRRKHSAVESAINGLEHGGLDVCPDHGIMGFKRYVGLAVLSRNIKRVGSILYQQAEEKEKRKRGHYKIAA